MNHHVVFFPGIWAVGLASKECDLNVIPLGKDNFSWVLRSSGTVMHADNVVVNDVAFDVTEGDYLVRILLCINFQYALREVMKLNGLHEGHLD